MTKNKHNFTLNNSSDGVNNNDDPSDHHDYSDDSMPPTPTISTFNKFPRQSSLRFKTPLPNDTPRSSSLGSTSNNNNHNHNQKSPFLDENEASFDRKFGYNYDKDKVVEEEDENEDEATYVVGEDNEDNEDENDNINEMDPSNLKTKRHRWGTTRHKHGRPKNENINRSKTLKKILAPHKSKGKSHSKNSHSLNKRLLSIRKPNTHRVNFPHDNQPPPQDLDFEEQNDPKNRKSEKRTVTFNRPLPPHLVDPETNKPLTNYPRNKIRTTKYTPLSFFPKNIWNQFMHNVANIYFLVLIILGAFEIFGVPSPVLAAVPLIVIVIITTIKDAIEDSRRTVTDLEVNNQITHILTQVNEDAANGYHYENVNVDDEQVSYWRQFKKWNTRLLIRFWGALKRNLTKEGRANKIRERYNRENNIDGDGDQQQGRKSFDSDIVSNRTSFEQTENPFNDTLRQSFQQQRQQQQRQSSSYRHKTMKFAKKYWKDVKVGDVLRIYNNDEVPADLVILATSDEDNCCYVETKNLDGETNLKVKQALKYSSINEKIHKADDLINHDFEIDSEGPHANLYSYQGNLKYTNRMNNSQSYDNHEDSQEAITINNLLLRGCTLRNTKWAIGIVVFTGDDTKIMLNAGVTPTKQSRMSRELNYYVLLNFILLFVICFISGLVNGIYYRETNTSRDYFEFGTIASTPALNGLVGFFVSLILYQSLVPISLYITIEIIKTAQAFFIYSDVGMYYSKLDFPCTPKSWSISDDLGQIEYIFSDKTGTLTQNLMEFKKCTINGVSYGKAYTEALAGLRKRMGIDVEIEAAQERELISRDKEVMIEKLHTINKNKTYDDEITFVSLEFIDDLTDSSINNQLQRESNHHFMLALALCHSVMTEPDPKQPNKLMLKAQSPDEAALVGTARSLGFHFKGTTKTGVIVDVHGETKEYQVLNTLEFNSTRKRMSSIIKIPGEGPNDEPRALLICKGADSIIYERLSATENDPSMLEKTSKHLEEYATEGLRTLCIAERELSWKQYVEWNKRHQAAASSLDDREAKMEAVADSIERELTLLGGTAIEDRLQDGVPDAISILADAGIKLWVLTGDKVETAINIGFSCNLLGNDMQLLVIKTAYNDDENGSNDDNSSEDKNSLQGLKFGHNASEPEIVDTVISYYLRKHFDMTGSFEEKEAAVGDHSPPDERFGVVIDGDALKLVLLSPDVKRKFLLLCKKCRAVLCCRVSPAQKAAVVKLVKDTLNVMTLAIGDGSNDVAMIQAADVGVGIAGEEGRQAVMSSDYAIGQFRYLARLLLTHGRWSYKRFSEMIPSFFYKNIIFNIALFWYGIYCDFDGTYLFEFTYLMFYNLAFTSLPVIFLGIFDQDVEAKVSLLVPQIYRTGITRTEMSDLKFYLYCLDGIYQSAISYFFPYLLYMVAFPNMNGKPVDHRFWMGVLVTCIACISCNCYILFHQFRWDWLSSLIVAISILIIFIWTGLWTVNYQSSGEFYKAAPEIFGMTAFWACMFVGILCCLIPRFFYDFVMRIFWPKDIDIIRECVARGDFEAYPFDYDPTDPNRPKISTYSSDVVHRMSMNYPSPPQTQATSTDSNGKSPSSSSLDNGHQSRNSNNLNGNGYYDQDNSSGSNLTYDRSIIFERVNESPINAHHQQPPTPPPGIIASPIRKRKGFVPSVFRNSSDSHIHHSNGHTNGSSPGVATEEIPLEDFDDEQKRASRISYENQKRVSSMN